MKKFFKRKFTFEDPSNQGSHEMTSIMLVMNIFEFAHLPPLKYNNPGSPCTQCTIYKTSNKFYIFIFCLIKSYLKLSNLHSYFLSFH